MRISFGNQSFSLGLLARTVKHYCVHSNLILSKPTYLGLIATVYSKENGVSLMFLISLNKEEERKKETDKWRDSDTET